MFATLPTFVILPEFEHVTECPLTTIPDVTLHPDFVKAAPSYAFESEFDVTVTDF